MRIVRHLSRVAVAFLVIVLGLLCVQTNQAHAADGEFSIEVSPSPLVATLKPGQTSTLPLHIRNTGTASEHLTITPRAFKVDSKGTVTLSDTALPDIASWLQFDAKDFSVEPGQQATQNLQVMVPKDAGFSYSFALVVTRQDTSSRPSGQQLKAKVAVFALLTIDRPGAVRSLEIEKVSTSSGTYENLPATINVSVKNTGNTIVQPTGNIFIQRGSNDTAPLDTLAANGTGGYILPGTTRVLSVRWENGFPVDRIDSADSTKTHTEWNWNSLSNLRIGRYVAKAVVVYNDGVRDTALSGEADFWVLPWKLIGAALIVVILIGFGVWSMIRNTVRFSGKKGKKLTLGK